MLSSGRGGRGGVDFKNPRSREDRPWKYIERIPIDESLFPAHVKPAAIIIGVKGSNHARMQDESGCCVQLRGRGISSPGTPGADEAMHLWIKYDTHPQLEKVRSVLDEIIRSCERGPPAELRKKPLGVTRGTPPQAAARPRAFPNVLPPKPTRPPQSPLECFFTLHYMAHAIPGITTDGFEQSYAQLFGYPLEQRLTALGGSLTGSLAMLPQIVRLEDPKTGQPVTEADPAGVYLVRPVQPMGMPWQAFYTHVTQQHQQAASPSPPPPPPPVASPETPGFRPQQSARSKLPPPQSLILQALHALLTKIFVSSLSNGAHSEGLTQRLRRWPGVRVNQLPSLFCQNFGINIDSTQLGYPDFGTLLMVVGSPEVVEVYYNLSAGDFFVRFGTSALNPDFNLIDSRCRREETEETPRRNFGLAEQLAP